MVILIRLIMSGNERGSTDHLLEGHCSALQKRSKIYLKEVRDLLSYNYTQVRKVVISHLQRIGVKGE